MMTEVQRDRQHDRPLDIANCPECGRVLSKGFKMIADAPGTVGTICQHIQCSNPACKKMVELCVGPRITVKLLEK